MLEKPIEPRVLISEQSRGLANQQGNSVIWLAGFVDGEGTLTFNCNWQRKTHTPRFQVCNTDLNALDYCKNILDSFGIKYHIQTQKMAAGWKVVWKIESCRRSEVKKVIELLLPYLVVKKRQAELILQFINTRSIGSYHGYTDEQCNMIAQVKKLNQRGPSETLRLPFKRQSEDKVQSQLNSCAAIN